MGGDSFFIEDENLLKSKEEIENKDQNKSKEINLINTSFKDLSIIKGGDEPGLENISFTKNLDKYVTNIEGGHNDNDITPDVCSDLKTLMLKSKNLKEVIWNGNNIELKGINNFVDILNRQIKLKSLCLRNTSLNFEAVSALSKGLINNECLKILDLGENNINIDSFKDICDCLNKSKIKIFRCKHNSLGDECAKYFAETILSKETNSVLTSFDFSSCKIYDQGLIYILHGLTENEKISWINLKDNFFSHEIDFVILNFLEKNSHLTHIDLTRNRFSFQCLQKVNKIIKRNRNIQNNKEPNKLLVELYSLKYENTKLNELKETLKIIENDNAKLKLNKIDLRADFELSKKEAGEKIIEICKSMTNPEPIEIGDYKGFKMMLSFDTIDRKFYMGMKNNLSYKVELGSDPSGNITRIDNVLNSIENRLSNTESSLEDTKKNYENAKIEIKRPFPQEDELKAKSKRLDELNIKLNLNEKDKEIVDDGGEDVSDSQVCKRDYER